MLMSKRSPVMARPTPLDSFAPRIAPVVLETEMGDAIVFAAYITKKRNRVAARHNVDRLWQAPWYAVF